MDAFVYIELDHGDEIVGFSDVQQITSLTEGSFVVPWNHAVFDALAGAHQAALPPEDQDPEVIPKYPPRGMPTPQSLAVSHDYFRLVTAPDRLPNDRFWPEHLCVPPETARKWLAKGSTESTVLQWFNCAPEGVRWRVVSPPEFFCASWLFPREFEEALAYRSVPFDSLPAEYVILRDAMNKLEEAMGKRKVRLVFWFC